MERFVVVSGSGVNCFAEETQGDGMPKAEAEQKGAGAAKTGGTGRAATGKSARSARTRTRERWLFALTLPYLLFLALIALGNASGPERWWGSVFNLYFPQWIWGLPALPLLLAGLIWARRAAILPALALLWVLGPLMGFCWPLRLFGTPVGNGTRLRVLTYNVKGGHRDMEAVLREIQDAHPDVLLLQDNGQAFTAALEPIFREWGWHHVAFSQYLIASRFPLTGEEPRPLALHGFSYLRCRMQVGATSVAVYDAHLLSPRFGLAPIRRHPRSGSIGLEQNATDRLAQSFVLASDIARETGPVLLTGDLNAPMPSLVCANLERVGLHDAFVEGGRGYGYTYGHTLPFRHSYVRIDHVFLSKQWRAQACWAGGAQGSDHRPVAADLVLGE